MADRYGQPSGGRGDDESTALRSNIIQENDLVLTRLRAFLDDVRYREVDSDLSAAIASADCSPKFERLTQLIESIPQPRQTIFRLLRIGDAVDEESLREVFPSDIAIAMGRIGLLRQTTDGQWYANSLRITAVKDLLIISSIPPKYPTARRQCRVWLDDASMTVVEALPLDLSGRKVLDVCSGSGVLSLIALSRGALHVVGLEIDREAVAVAQANAIINGFSKSSCFRVSDTLSALRHEEKFNFVVCNGPFRPMVRERPIENPQDVGNAVLMRLIGRLNYHLAASVDGLLAIWNALGTESDGVITVYQAKEIERRLRASSVRCTFDIHESENDPKSLLDRLAGDEYSAADDIRRSLSNLRLLLLKEPRRFRSLYDVLIRIKRRGRDCRNWV